MDQLPPNVKIPSHRRAAKGTLLVLMLVGVITAGVYVLSPLVACLFLYVIFVLIFLCFVVELYKDKVYDFKKNRKPINKQ